jgi:hypothetical protein
LLCSDNLEALISIYTVGRTPWMENQLRKAATYTQDNRSRIKVQTSMLRVGFEPTSPEFEWAKTFHNVIGHHNKKKTDIRGLSPGAHSSDRAASPCRRS